MKLRDNMSVVQSMAFVQDAMDKLDDEAERMKAKLDRLSSDLECNREQRKRLETGYRALSNRPEVTQ